MKQMQTQLNITTSGRGMIDITRPVAAWLEECHIHTGMLHLLIQHTSCSLLIQENADPSVQSDMERFLARLIPDGDPIFEHQSEGDDDMPAHVRTALTATSLSIPIHRGKMGLGIWQGIYVYEHRLHHTTRHILAHVMGDA